MAVDYTVKLPVAGRLVVVVGGGERAARQVAALRAAGARIRLVAPGLSPSLAGLAARGLIEARRRWYEAGDLAGAWLVHACSGEPAVDAAVAADAERARLWCAGGDDAAALPDTEREPRAGHVPVAGQADGYAEGAAPAPGEHAAAARPPRRVLVLGGARSGKSAAAEGLLAGCAAVDYLATGLPPDGGDPEWAERVAGHRLRRPAHWRTVETLDLAAALRGPGGPPVLVDCLSTWLARVMDECGAWEGRPGAAAAVHARLTDLVAAWRASTRPVVAVSNEVGSGVVPGTRSGRLFRDELGSLNTRIAAECDEVWLCTAGVPRRLR